MRTLNLIVVVLVSVVLSVGFVACADSDSPTAPSSSSSSSVVPVPVASAGGATLQPAGFDTLQPGTGEDSTSFNAYDFDASYDDGMLTLILIEDQMTDMREASKPHRNRMITVGICPSEPHHALQACGDPIWQGSMVLRGRLELDPIPLASCEGWIVVNAAELSDDKYDGWRNAPCPQPDDTTVTSDGRGNGWPEYPQPEPEPEPAPPIATPAPAPAPMPETPMMQVPNPVRLLFTLNDQRGDGAYNYDFGSNNYLDPLPYPPLPDLKSFRMWTTDVQGWFVVEFETWETVDPGMKTPDAPGDDDETDLMQTGWRFSVVFRYPGERRPWQSIEANVFVIGTWSLNWSSSSADTVYSSDPGSEEYIRAYNSPTTPATTFRFGFRLPSDFRNRNLDVEAESEYWVGHTTNVGRDAVGTGLPATARSTQFIP